MTNSIKCPSKLYVPVGVTGSNSATDQDLITVIPAIKHKVLVSFSTQDCKAINVDSLHEDILDQVIDIFLGKFSSENLSISEKRSLILHEAGDYIFGGRLKTLEQTDILYLTNLFLYLNCLTNLEFEIVEDNLYDIDTSEYKISICGVKDHLLRDIMKKDAHTFISFGQNPTQCFIAIDDEESISNSSILQYRQNKLGHEFLHCLGLNHPSYQSIQENIKHRSIMEDLSPIVIDCMKKSHTPIKCANQPTMPTGEDICTLNSLYGNSLNESSVCNEVVQNFVATHPYIKLETSGSINIGIDL